MTILLSPMSITKPFSTVFVITSFITVECFVLFKSKGRGVPVVRRLRRSVFPSATGKVLDV